MKEIIKKILPPKTIWILTEKREEFREFKARIIKNNFILLSIAIAFDSHYINEHKAFLNGAFIYESSKRKRKKNIHFLRRNIHRIEKGMIMIPRREEFALRFILQTVQSYQSLILDSDFNSSESIWSFQVLTKYFLMVKSTNSNYLKSFEIFSKLKEPTIKEEKIPFYKPKDKIVNYNDFLQLNQTRKSVRWFESKLVENEKISQALKVAASSPSSCNRSPFRYIISNQSSELTRKIAEVSAGTAGWNQNIPAIAVLIGQQRAFSNISNRHSIYVDGTLSVMPFILALETLGLSTCLINWADNPSNEKRMKSLIPIEEDEKIIISIAIGYQLKDSLVAYSERKNISEISHFI